MGRLRGREGAGRARCTDIFLGRSLPPPLPLHIPFLAVAANGGGRRGRAERGGWAARRATRSSANRRAGLPPPCGGEGRDFPGNREAGSVPPRRPSGGYPIRAPRFPRGPSAGPRPPRAHSREGACLRWAPPLRGKGSGGVGGTRGCEVVCGGGAAIRRGGAGPGAAASPHSRCACVSVCMYVCVCVRAGGARHGGSGGRGERRWARCGTEPPAPRSAPCAGPPQPRLAPPRSARPSQLRARPTSRAFPAPVSCFRGSPDSSKRARGGFPRRAARTLIQSTCRIPPASPPPSHKSTALGTAPRCGGSWQLRLRSPSPHLPAVLPIPPPTPAEGHRE